MEFLAANRRRLSLGFARSSGSELEAAVFAGYLIITNRLFDMWPLFNRARFLVIRCLNAPLTYHIKIGLGFPVKRALQEKPSKIETVQDISISRYMVTSLPMATCLMTITQCNSNKSHT